MRSQATKPFGRDLIDVRVVALCLAPFVPAFLLAYRYTRPAEDAVILYEYARNLADKGVITYGGSDMPVEGATDFLWMVMLALGKALGINEFGASLLITFVALGLVVHVFAPTRQAAVIVAAAACTPFLYAGLNGFSVIAFSAVYLVSLRLLMSGSRSFYPSVLLLCLLRPDGAVWGAGGVVWRVWQARGRGALAGEFRALLAGLVGPGVLYWLWRSWYFSEWWPLSFLVKSAAARDLGLFHWDSVAYIAPVAVPLAATLAVYASRKAQWIQSGLLFGAPLLFYASMQLEQNIGNRFMAPLFFGGLYLVARWHGRRALVLGALLVAGCQIGETRAVLSTLANSTRETLWPVSTELGALRGRLLTTEAGRLAYNSRWFTEDSWGLNTPRFAHRLISEAGVADGDYDLIVAHCDLQLLAPDADVTHDGSRTWDHHCRTLAAHIRKGSYEVFLVPYFDARPTFRQRVYRLFGRDTSTAQRSGRHVIFAVSASYEDRREVARLLLNYGAIRALRQRT